MKEDSLKRILVFNVNWIGDVLFSTAVIRNIRYNYPKGYISCIIPERCYPVLEGNPYLDEIIIFDEKNRHQGLSAKISFIRLIKRKRFDTAILLHGSFTRALICKIAGIPELIGYATKKRGFLLAQKIAPLDKDAVHRIDYYLNIIKQSGFEVKDRYLEFFVPKQDEDFAEDFLNKYLGGQNDFLIGINPGGNWLPKRWPKENWIKLTDLLMRKPGVRVVITGGKEDLPLAREITAALKSGPLVICGVFNLKQSAALFKRLNVFISADSGPMHIANAVGTKKIIALFGPTDPSITGPYPQDNVIIFRKDAGCKIPCYVVDCQDNRCMKEITAEEVIGKIW
ncbi:MAG: lipopolysaccharide heptosyltransferase II [Candidatus Omnitrophota bacterium]